MPSHKCPVCRQRLVIHPSARTCSHTCAKEWRMMSYEQQARALSGEDDLDDKPEKIQMDQAELDKWIRSNKE